jgi:hypothetical protein
MRNSGIMVKMSPIPDVQYPITQLLPLLFSMLFLAWGVKDEAVMGG